MLTTRYRSRSPFRPESRLPVEVRPFGRTSPRCGDELNSGLSPCFATNRFLAAGWSGALPRKPNSMDNSSASLPDSDLIWSGFFSRSKANRVGVDAYVVKGMFKLKHAQYHIDIPYRTPFPHKELARTQALLVFEAENSTYQAAFQEYVTYFRSKDRVGYVPLSATHDLYLSPRSPAALELFPRLNAHQFLGIVVPRPTHDRRLA